MKNIFRFVMAVAVLFTASCAKEDISSSIVGGGEVEMTFTVDLPELGTRAYGDGAKATTLRYYVYDDDNYLRGISSETLGTTTLTNGKAVVTLPLLKGMTYNIVFWADNGGEFYSYDTASKTITVDYTGAKANDDNRDAFYKYLPAVDPATATAEQTNIVLTRPFAQLNAATNDFEAVDKSGVTLTESTVKVTTFTTLDLTNGQSGTPVEVTFDATTMPCMLTPEETLMANYKYLSMNYLLPGTVDAEFTFKGTRSNGSEIVFTGTKYSAVPLKANYRTNILGALLTKPTDFTVTIDAEFGGEFEKFKYPYSHDTILANVFNADANWKVYLYEDGVLTGEMERIPVTRDSVPEADSSRDWYAVGYHIGVVGRSYGKVTDSKSKWNGGGRKGYLTQCNHLYRLQLKNPDAKQIKVVAKDTNGNVYEQTRFTESFDYSECALTNKLLLTPREELDKTY